MKHIIFSILIIVVISMMLSSCDKYEYAGCAVCYYIPTSLEASVDYMEPKITVRVYVKSNKPVYHVKDRNSERREIYNKYSEYYHDTKYKIYDDEWGIGEASCNPLSKISVSCDRDWNSAHPANTAIDDLIYAGIATLKPYIDNNYQEFNNWEHGELADFNYEKCNPFMSFFDLYIPHPSDKSGKYTLTITVNFDNDPITGKSVSVEPVEVEVEF